MRRLSVAILLLLTACLFRLSAFEIMPETGSVSTSVVNGNDTLLFFSGAIELKTDDDSKVDWYRLSDLVNPVATNSSTCYMFNSGDGVYAKAADGTVATCCVFDYDLVKPVLNKAVIEYYCDTTYLTLSIADNPALGLDYTTSAGAQTYYFEGTLHYSNASWNSDSWDSVGYTMTIPLKPSVVGLPPIYAPSAYAYIEYDNISQALNISVVQDVYADEQAPAAYPRGGYTGAVAVSVYPVSVVTKRDALNEVSRPASETIVESFSYSGSLNVLFKSNPSPNVDFVNWRIYKGKELLAQRTDEDQRYEFIEPASYTSKVAVSNRFCPCDDCLDDTTEFKIELAESMLMVPNVFTPDGNGQNDEFRVLYRSIKEFHCEIYNRWGKLVYKWDDPAKGWDGTIGGRPAAEGAYYYVIRALGTDAKGGYRSRASYNKAKKDKSDSIIGIYQLSGDINLIRGK